MTCQDDAMGVVGPSSDDHARRSSVLAAHVPSHQEYHPLRLGTPGGAVDYFTEHKK